MAEHPTPKPAGTEVLLKVLAAGVCHSDLHLSDGYFDLGGGKRLSVTERGMKLPITLGHENVGEVIAVGPQARGLTIGDRVLVDPWMGCGECGVCARGYRRRCARRGGPDQGRDQRRRLGGDRPGWLLTHRAARHR